MAIITRSSIFASSVGTTSGTLDILDSIVGTTVEITLVGEGGAGGSGDASAGHGGGGGGAGAVVFGNFPVTAGDTLTITHTPSNDRTTSGNGANGGSISVTNGTTTWTANGGRGGTTGNAGAGGAGGTGSGSGATIITGGDGGNAGTTGGAGGQDGQAASGGQPGTGGANGSNGNGGGGGGRVGGVPQYLSDDLTAAGVWPLVSRNGGAGASSTAHVVGARNATDTTYLSFDGQDGKIDSDPLDEGVGELEFLGMGGGGAGAPHATSTGDGLGGGGGQAICYIRYQLDVPEPTFNLTGNTTAAAPHLVEIGGSFIEPGVNATDFEGTICTVTTTLPQELESPISGTLGQQYTVDYTATDLFGGTNTAERVCQVQDTTGPVIRLVGDNPFYVLHDPQNANGYVEPGADGIDNDGTTYTTAQITIDSSAVDTSIKGTYDVTYDLTDSSGNPATQVIRTVQVVDELSPAANNTGPIETPNSGTISFGQILAASQLWREARPDNTKSRLNLSDAHVRLKATASIDALRTWFVGHGLCPGATVDNNTLPGAKSNVGLAASSFAGSRVSASTFRGYHALTTQLRVRPETYDHYRNKDDAQIEVVCWGATTDRDNLNATGSNQQIYTVNLSNLDATGAGYTVANVGYGDSSNMNLATFVSLGERVHSPATGNSSVPGGRRDPNTTHVYDVTITYTPAGASGTITYTGLQVQIGHSGSTDNQVKIKTASGTADRNFLWNNSDVATAGVFSDSILQHVGFTSVER